MHNWNKEAELTPGSPILIIGVLAVAVYGPLPTTTLGAALGYTDVDS